MATFLLTGARKNEVFGLEAEDVSFKRKTVTIRSNDWRSLKTSHSARTIPLWPQLEAVLGPYIMPADRTPRTGLLFPGRNRTGQPSILTDFGNSLDRAVQAAGLENPDHSVTPKVFRHTYCAARLQSLDNGHPVSPYTVQREMGHGSPAMINRVYGHLGQFRHRTEGVEYLPAPVEADVR